MPESKITEELKDKVNEVVDRIGFDDASTITEYATHIVMDEMGDLQKLMIASILKALGIESVTISSELAQDVDRQMDVKNYVLDEIPTEENFTFRLRKVADNPVKSQEEAFFEAIAKAFGV
jgi:arginyl-tRNA synthetase